MSRERIGPKQVQLLQEALSADFKEVNIRLREGEYQYALARAIALFMLEPYFPNVKEITEKLYGKEKAESISFRRNIQTILKKMEKSEVVKILPKKKPWQLQSYGLSSFKFEDVDGTSVVLAQEHEIDELQDMLDSLTGEGRRETEAKNKKNIFILLSMIAVSYTAVLWGLTRSTINPFIFVSAFSLAVIFSVMLGKMLANN